MLLINKESINVCSLLNILISYISSCSRFKAMVIVDGVNAFFNSLNPETLRRADKTPVSIPLLNIDFNVLY